MGLIEADMKVDKVANMEVDLVVGKVVYRVAHTVADMDFSIIFSVKLFVFPSDPGVGGSRGRGGRHRSRGPTGP